MANFKIPNFLPYRMFNLGLSILGLYLIYLLFPIWSLFYTHLQLSNFWYFVLFLLQSIMLLFSGVMVIWGVLNLFKQGVKISSELNKQKVPKENKLVFLSIFHLFPHSQYLSNQWWHKYIQAIISIFNILIISITLIFALLPSTIIKDILNYLQIPSASHYYFFWIVLVISSAFLISIPPIIYRFILFISGIRWKD